MFLPILFLLFIFNLYSAEIHYFDKMEKQNLCTTPWQDEDWNSHGFCEYLRKVDDLQQNPQPFKMRKNAFEIINKVHENFDLNHATILQDTQTWDDICLFHGNLSEDPYVGSLIDRTQTEFGKVTLYRMLLPTKNIALVKKRQEIVQLLLDNPELLSNLQNVLQEIKSVQNLLLSFWINDPIVHTTGRYYFEYPILQELNDTLNHNAHMMMLRCVTGHQGRLGNMILLGGTVAAPFLYYGYKHCFGFNGISDEQIPVFIKKIHDRFKNDGDRYFNFLISLFKNEYVTESGQWCTAFFCALGMKSFGDWIKGNFLMLKLLQKRLIDVRSFLDCTQKMHELCIQYPALCQLCDLLSYIDQDNVTIKTMPKFALFKNVMQKNTFKDVPSVFSYYGNILSGYKLTYAVKDDLEGMIAAVGELDAYVSLATLYKEHAYTSAQYCFAKFVESDAPVLIMEQAWNPFVDVERVVANDIMFGEGIPTHAIVTGPNAGGKSTILKGLFIGALLAQSVGLVPASKCMLTPFSYMATYMNITDDIVAGKSLFKAEVARAHDLLEQIKDMPQHEFSFIVMDEIFSGTNPKEGQAAAYSVAKHIGDFDNVVCFIATHYDLLTQLEQFGSFVNFHVSVQKQTRGFHYPFKLKCGVSNQHIALDILQDDGFASDIVDTARTVIVA
ncbi:MAG: hypothetical protein WD055_06015 [Candidatus Dependentiae bacterium]